MKKAVATRVDEKDKESFKKIAHKYQMSESVLLRLVIRALVKNDSKLMPFILDIVKKEVKGAT